MVRVMMTEGPMSGQVIEIVDPREAAQVLDKGYAVRHVDEEDKPKPAKPSRAKRVRHKRKTERATAPVETPEG